MTPNDWAKAVEAILIDYQMHQPQCAKRRTEKAQAHTGAFLIPPECDCWLASPRALIAARPAADRNPFPRFRLFRWFR